MAIVVGLNSFLDDISVVPTCALVRFQVQRKDSSLNADFQGR